MYLHQPLLSWGYVGKIGLILSYSTVLSSADSVVRASLGGTRYCQAKGERWCAQLNARMVAVPALGDLPIPPQSALLNCNKCWKTFLEHIVLIHWNIFCLGDENHLLFEKWSVCLFQPLWTPVQGVWRNWRGAFGEIEKAIKILILSLRPIKYSDQT